MKATNSSAKTGFQCRFACLEGGGEEGGEGERFFPLDLVFFGFFS